MGSGKGDEMKVNAMVGKRVVKGRDKAQASRSRDREGDMGPETIGLD